MLQNSIFPAKSGKNLRIEIAYFLPNVPNDDSHPPIGGIERSNYPLRQLASGVNQNLSQPQRHNGSKYMA
jgi:hypothetical protein